jgi:hypothetical protein
MASKIVVIILLVSILISGSCQSKNEDFLIKVCKGNFDEVGAECAYVNLKGDTIIRFGHYQYCYTDTLKDIAIVIKNDGKLIAIDRNEKELFEVMWYDNGPDYISDGLFRIKKNNKIGYSNNKGEIIIEPQFDCAFPFENGKAKVSNDCKTISEDEYSQWVSDKWYFIDRKGKKIN